MPSWKAKKFGETGSRNPVLEHIEVGSPAESTLTLLANSQYDRRQTFVFMFNMT
jgi:hypothetical protein